MSYQPFYLKKINRRNHLYYEIFTIEAFFLNLVKIKAIRWIIDMILF
jgi:hypothetical protein